MNGPRQQLLARAAFAREQDPRIGSRHHVGLRQFVLHELIAGDDARAPIFIHMREARHFEGLLHVIEKVLLVDRFGEKSEGAALGGMNGIGNRAVGRQDDHPQSGPAALQLFEEADAVHLVHAQVRDDEIRPEAHAGGERGGRAFDCFDFVVLGAQADREQAQQSRVIVHHQDSSLALLRGLRVPGGARMQAE